MFFEPLYYIDNGPLDLTRNYGWLSWQNINIDNFSTAC
jgi:hypothetical protein